MSRELWLGREIVLASANHPKSPDEGYMRQVTLDVRDIGAVELILGCTFPATVDANGLRLAWFADTEAGAQPINSIEIVPVANETRRQSWCVPVGDWQTLTFVVLNMSTAYAVNNVTLTVGRKLDIMSTRGS